MVNALELGGQLIDERLPMLTVVADSWLVKEATGSRVKKILSQVFSKAITCLVKALERNQSAKVRKPHEKKMTLRNNTFPDIKLGSDTKILLG